MAFCQLGDYSFRIAPSSVIFPFEVDSTVINTVGGRVVQVYGVTLGDMVVQGLFGQERTGQTRDSWQLAEEFQERIGQMVIKQSTPPTTGQLAGYDRTPMHEPLRFVFNDDSVERRQAGLPIHNWDFQVYIKKLEDSDGSGYTVTHETGKFSYGYTLTLFIVEDNSRTLRQVAVDKFINRLAAGVGWKRSEYNGPMTTDELEAYVKQNSPDGTIHGLVLKQFQDASSGSSLPGGQATVDAAQQALGDTGDGG
jgi:hypothetical protein